MDLVFFLSLTHPFLQPLSPILVYFSRALCSRVAGTLHIQHPPALGGETMKKKPGENCCTEDRLEEEEEEYEEKFMSYSVVMRSWSVYRRLPSSLYSLGGVCKSRIKVHQGALLNTSGGGGFGSGAGGGCLFRCWWYRGGDDVICKVNKTDVSFISTLMLTACWTRDRPLTATTHLEIFSSIELLTQN